MNYVVVDFEWNQACYGKGSENRKIPFEIIEIGAVKLDENLREIDVSAGPFVRKYTRNCIILHGI